MDSGCGFTNAYYTIHSKRTRWHRLPFPAAVEVTRAEAEITSGEQAVTEDSGRTASAVVIEIDRSETKA
jgi:hypothetical protein